MDINQRIQATEAIKILKARYFRYLDTKEWDGLRNVFADDALVEIPEAEKILNGADDALAFIKAAVDGATSVHFGHMPEIDIVSENHATGIWALDDRIYWPDGQSKVLGYAVLRGFGHYHETYARIHDEWKIKTMRLTRLRLTVLPPPRAVP